ncbi:30S ribosomal protein S13 [Candidatus Woesearchaeota archaeon]|nr:30S ribosomal protein S13 [Candidatus Woesearchaeota archaeon]
MIVKQLIRIGNSDLDGSKEIQHALRKIKGIGFMMANAVCFSAGVENRKKAGELSAEEITKIEEVIKDPKGIPVWMYNRRKDYDQGIDKHLFTTNLNFAKEFDVKRLQKIKSYRGLRHAWGLPVRGQRTRSNFRRGTSVGVVKKSIKSPEKAKESKK